MAEPSTAKAEGAEGAQRKQVRGYIDGCFDIMHSGHYNAIRQAKCLCDVLVVGVHSDAEIEENKAMPVMQQAERYALLEHIKWIDEILHDVPYSPQLATLERARADFCIHGDDMPVNAQGVCAYDEMRQAGRLRIVKRTEGVSTTDLIGRLLTLSRQQSPAEWCGSSSPALGVRVSADDAIGHCTSSFEAAASSSDPPEAVASLLATVDELAAKYGIGTDDVLRLKSGVRSASAVALPRSAASAGKEEVSSNGNAETAEARTRAPVQLLASTRRITEFASARQPTREDRVVYACGSFDMFHVGHAQFLREARELGTFLLVGIYDDATVSRSKGPNYPVMNLNERVLNVCACKWVDEVIIGAPRDVTEDLIKTWDIHVVARGTNHLRNENLSSQAGDHFSVPQRLGVYVEIPSRWPDLCHETVVQRIVKGRELYLRRNRDRARREDVYYAAKNQETSPPEA